MLRDRGIADQVRETQVFCMRRSSREQATVREVLLNNHEYIHIHTYVRTHIRTRINIR